MLGRPGVRLNVGCIDAEPAGRRGPALAQPGHTRRADASLLGELGVSHEALVARLAEEGARLVEVDDWRPEELPLEGWEEFTVTGQEHELIRGRFHAVNQELGQRGVRFTFGQRDDDPESSLVRIHPGGSGLDPRVVLDRLLGRAP